MEPRLAVRFVDVHSGRNDVVGDVETVSTLLRAVERCLEGGRPGSRFPLIRLLGRAAPLTGAECEALVREIARLRGLLAGLAAQNLVEEAGPRADDDRQTPADGPPRGAFGPVDGAPRTLADAFAWPLSVLEHVGRLGAMGGRGARFETGPLEAMVAARTPLPVPARAIAG